MYKVIYAATGTTKVGLWRPRIATVDNPTALLLGRAPDAWHGTDPSDQARLLVDAGYWVLTVETPNWGNATDMTNINAALTWLETNWSRSIDRLVIVGHNAGCVAALNWGMRNHHRVASMSLQSPIVDLQERYTRVPADRASMELAFGGSNALSLPGTNGNYASTPDHASLDIISDIDIRAEIAAADWTPTTSKSIVSKYVTVGNQRSYRLRLLASGFLELVWTIDGTSQRNAISTAAPVVANGAKLAVRVTLDVDNGASGRTTTFYTAPTIGGSWTQLGSPVIAAAVTNIHSGTAPLEVGSVATGTETFQGNIYKVEVRNSINGTVVASPDFSAQTAGATSFADSTGKTWTLQGTAAISSAFVSAMRTWNPGHAPHRIFIVADMLGDRLKMWWSAADTQTPPAVTAALAAGYGADTGTLSNQNPVLEDPAPLVADAVAADVAWFNQPAHVEMKKWHSYVETSLNHIEYKGGDACTTTILPDGRWVTTFADSFLTNISPAVPTGSDISDGTYLSIAGPARNMMVVHDSSGAITNQVYGPNGPGNWPPLEPNQTTYPAHWYWPISKIIDNGALQVACWIVNLSSGTFGHIADSHIVTVDPDTLETTAVTPLNVGEIFSTYGLFSDGGIIYVLGQEYVGGYDDYDIDTVTQTRIARVPVGQLTTPGSWEFRTASGWSPLVGNAVPIKDSTAVNLVGDSTITKSGSDFVLAAFGPTEGAVRIYSSSNPWGPWTLYHTVPIPQLGAARYGSMAVGYHPKWHPHLNADGRLMLGWNGNFFSTGGPSSPWDDLDYLHFSPHFLLIPPP